MADVPQHNLQSETHDLRSPLVDSPWFWVLIFAGMGLVALVAMGPKYGGRQAELELEYQARSAIAAERAARNSGKEAARIDEAVQRRKFASPERTLVPLWPLALILSLVVIVSAIMLYRGRRRSAVSAEEGSP
jgi:hypothetical protein